MTTLKKIILSCAFPVLMFLVMFIITASSAKCYVNGKLIFLSADMVKQVFVNTCMTSCVALAIWLQLKNGRFDFSGGASMILTAIIAGNVGIMTGSPWVAILTAIAVGIVLSCLTAVVYIVGRLPIIICTIGMTLLYESLTYLVFGGQGIRVFYSTAATSVFGRMPGVLFPTALAVAAFVIFNYFTAAGRKGKILSNNQRAGVNIGIDEKKNVVVSYIYTGVIIGLAAIIYVSQNEVTPQSGLATSSILFSYIVPVFMGTFIGLASCDVIGIMIAACGMEIMNYGLNCLNLGAGGWQQIIMGIFVLGFYAFSAQTDNIRKLFQKKNKVKGY
jgi:ribose/xylose/arabinose/galactoside ABC-type transport system permease subunit